ncbi:hypothetical protein GW17_00052435 [Ensete ventricosum]|nr:hypothetical protein GW17_00052435 [Ensete ventricosum]
MAGKSASSADGWGLCLTPRSPMRYAASGSLIGLRSDWLPTHVLFLLRPTFLQCDKSLGQKLATRLSVKPSM